jgi:plasmid stabilization system protein ParE
VLDDLFAGMEKVGRTPALGHPRPDLTPDPVVFFLVHRYFIVFVATSSPVGVARVIHSARDVSAVLGS